MTLLSLWVWAAALTTSKTFTALFFLQYDIPTFVGMGRRLDHIEDVYRIVLFTI
jgi:hypothetical protein